MDGKDSLLSQRNQLISEEWQVEHINIAPEEMNQGSRASALVILTEFQVRWAGVGDL